MNLKKASICIRIAIVGILVLYLSACHTSKSYTFQIENGEMIKVSLDTSDGYDLIQNNGRFSVEKEDKAILQGYFLSEEGYAERRAMILEAQDVTIKRTEKEPDLYVYQCQGEVGLETDYLVQVMDAKTGIVIGSLNSYEEAEAAFSLMTFEKE